MQTGAMPQAESIPASVCINNVIITHISDKSVTKIDIFPQAPN